jgi:AcrR family transcriptional regulator
MNSFTTEDGGKSNSNGRSQGTNGRNRGTRNIAVPVSLSTRDKILYHSINLFAEKGFTDTSVREIAAAVGLRESSIYNHFPSKNAILEYILEDYTIHNSGAFLDRKALAAILKENPSSEGFLICLQLVYPAGKEQFYLRVLHVLLQEQHRDNTIRRFVAEKIILYMEQNVVAAMDTMKELEMIRQDSDPDLWMKICSSLVYAYASRMLMGIGDSSYDYVGFDMKSMLKSVFDMLLTVCGKKDVDDAGGYHIYYVQQS